ncbi:DMT family transporter [Pararhodobacter marinus]|uniref:EamA/RhaT family transporter n=1 Tax=Pararhodobacter marinus TaxID=2184063 RepID=A0A2U2CI11_9RHOB|nr:DMT family transporter [Pararhodobacter marinus]PWE31516.1 EamA/RhaT family transporter [Pararhodobacter marinus]
MSANPLAPHAAGPSTGIATLGVILASVGFGIVPLFARSLTEAGMAPHAVAMYRYLLASVVLAPVVWRWRHHARVMVWGLMVGAAIGLGWVAYVRAVEVAPVSTVGVLYMTYPAFTLVFAWALFGERPSWRAVIGAGVILLAAVLVTTPGAVAVEHVPALLLSLAAPAGFGFGISVLVHRMTPIPALARIGIVSAGSMLGLMPLLLSTPATALMPVDSAGWMMVVGVGLATALVPQLLYTVCSPIIGTARTAIAGSIELPVMFAIGWLAFGEGLRPVQIVACAMVLGAILLTPARQPRSIAADRQDAAPGG